jgi:hypothetical protein
MDFLDWTYADQVVGPMEQTAAAGSMSAALARLCSNANTPTMVTAVKSVIQLFLNNFFRGSMLVSLWLVDLLTF